MTAACLAAVTLGAGLGGPATPAAAAPVAVGPVIAAPEPVAVVTAPVTAPVAAPEVVVTPEAAAAPARAAVRTTGSPLNVRNNASTWNRPVAVLANGAAITASCQLGGETISGTERTTSTWLRISEGRYVSDAYVRWSRRPSLPWCDQKFADPPTDQAGFIRFAARRAAASHRDFGVPISVSIAQAINESGWGRSSLTVEGNAYFGIKCFGTPGPIAAGCRPYRTSECDRNGCGPTVATFRVYPLASRSFLDHGRFLAVTPRYRRAFAYTRNPDRFAREIHRAGYATDPAYSDKLINLMRRYDLYRYDR